MAFYHIKGPAKTEPFQKTASIAIAVGSVIGFDGTNGFVEQAEAASTRIAGIALKKVTSSDDDYASNTTIPVVVPGPDDVFEATVSGTATQANVGKRYDLTANTDGTAQSVNLSSSTYGVVTVVGFKDSSTVYVKFNGNFVFADIST